ncbi:MAG: hypothetical protein ACM3YE_04835 [Bacteroidota bacterium]
MKIVSEGKDSGLHDLWVYFRTKPVSIWILIGLIGLGTVLLTSGNPREEYSKENFEQKRVEVETSSPNSEPDEERLERELTKTLTGITGVGEVRVDINLKVGNRKIWEREAHISKRVNQDQGAVNTEETTSDELVLAKDREGRDLPVLKEELAPVIEGVVVVATGAHDSRIRKLLTDTVTTILGLPGHRVLVIPGK